MRKRKAIVPKHYEHLRAVLRVEEHSSGEWGGGLYDDVTGRPLAVRYFGEEATGGKVGSLEEVLMWTSELVRTGVRVNGEVVELVRMTPAVVAGLGAPPVACGCGNSAPHTFCLYPEELNS